MAATSPATSKRDWREKPPEVPWLDHLDARLNAPFSPKAMKDKLWRLNNLYWSINDQGQIFRFIMKDGMFDLMAGMWWSNLILKARQYGFTTFIDLFILDECIFHPNQRAQITAHNLDDAKTIFRDKVKYPFEHIALIPPGFEPHAGMSIEQWEGLRVEFEKRLYPVKRESTDELLFRNNSSIRVTTSGRSGTLQWLHVSELGKIAAQYPNKAREVKTGSLPAAEKGTVFIESTAEGQSGFFFDLCDEAQENEKLRRALTRKEWKFHFHPWWKDPSRRLPSDGVLIPARLIEYFAKLEQREGIKLDAEQKVWYSVTERTLGDDMKREHPSTAEEAFQASIEGAYFSHEMRMAREEGRIRKVPYVDGIAVDTWWDLGMDDYTSIILTQTVGREPHAIDFLEDSGYGLKYYVNQLFYRRDEYGWQYGRHLLPPDIAVRELGTGVSRGDQLMAAGLSTFEIAPASQDKADDIAHAKDFHLRCWFDEDHCKDLLVHLDNYRKEWDEVRGQWKSIPRHDEHSHAADAFLLWAKMWDIRLWGAATARPVKRRSSKGWT